MDASDVVVTLLTGRRPELLARTLGTVTRHAPGLLETAHVEAFHNGADGGDATSDILTLHTGVIDELHVRDELLEIGPATGLLAARAAASGQRWWLHLEDDWAATSAHDGWLDLARELLEHDADLSQVRLRRAAERVLSHHMVTGRPLRWRDHGEYRHAKDAHWTNNPALMRAVDAMVAWPAKGERDAQRRWHAAGRRAVAQLTPGVFEHLGEADSLRRVVGATP